MNLTLGNSFPNMVSFSFGNEQASLDTMIFTNGEEYTLEGFTIDIRKFSRGMKNMSIAMHDRLARVDTSELTNWKRKNKRTIAKISKLKNDELALKMVHVPTGIIELVQTTNILNEVWRNCNIVDDLVYMDKMFRTLLISIKQNNPEVKVAMKQAMTLLSKRCASIKPTDSLMDEDVNVPVEVQASKVYKTGHDVINHMDQLDLSTELILKKVAGIKKLTDNCANSLGAIITILDENDNTNNVLDNAFRSNLIKVATGMGDYLTAFGKSSLISMACQHNWIVTAEGLLKG